MKTRTVLAWILPVTLLLLAAGSGLARGPQSSASSSASNPSSTDASPAAAAPWFIETVDAAPKVGQHVSMAIDPAGGTTYISYYDATYKNLEMAEYVGSGGNCGSNNNWSCATVDDSSNYVGTYSSIAIDPTTSQPKIAYYDATAGALKMAYVWNGSWHNRTIDSTKGGHVSLKIDATGTEHIAYYYVDPDFHVYSLNYATNDGVGLSNCGDGYHCDVLHKGNGVGRYPSLALDASGQPRIAYYDADNDDLWYAQSGTPANCGPGNSWLCHPVAIDGDVGRYASLDLDNGNVPHIAFYDATDGKLMHAKYVGGGSNCGLLGSWRCDEIDSMGTDPHIRDVSLAVDRDGNPVIAYHKYIIGTQFSIVALNVTRPAAALGLQSGNCGPGNLWWCERIRDPGHSGDYLAIVLRPSGLATVAYLNSEYAGLLRVAYQRVKVFMPLVVREH